MTFESVPPDYSSVNDSLVWVVYDAHATDPTTYPNYKYVAELYVLGVLVTTSRRFQQPDNNRGIFDFGTVIREYITAELPTISSGILAKEMASGEWQTTVQVKIREEYSGTIGAVVLTDSQRVFFNHYNGRTDEFTILDSFGGKPLSTRQLNLEVFLTNDNFFLPYFATSSGNFNVNIVGDTSHTKVVAAVNDNSLQLLNISPGAINSEYPGTISAATQRYTVEVGGVTYTCNLVCEPVWVNYPVHFLNQFGGFETFNFYKVSKTSYEITRKKWQQPAYRVDGSGVVSLKTGNIMHEQKTNFGVKFISKLKLSTNLLQDADYQFLSQLITSPLIYIQDGTILYPVTIEQSNYEPKQIEVDNWTNLEIEVTFGSTYKTQFR